VGPLNWPRAARLPELCHLAQRCTIASAYATKAAFNEKTI